ncbi:hypothetical protein ACP4OV_010064 [Aristida adscensionis]
MRPIRNGAQFCVGNLVEKQSLAAVKELWNVWEIHSLILVSLFLQVLLFLMADMRRRSTSSVLHTVLWLAYLSADAVAIFVLGHLAVRASEPRHQLMSFWAPFVLVHLGGQDTITALAKQDNELWRRHLLTLVTQVAVAGYVVAKASWHDTRLKAAMLLVFLSGCVKYADRIVCLFFASQANLRSEHLRILKYLLHALNTADGYREQEAADDMKRTLDKMSRGMRVVVGEVILSVDAPPNDNTTVLAAEDLPSLLAEFQSSANHYRAYDSVGAYLVYRYMFLYTKILLRECLYILYTEMLPQVFKDASSFFDAVLVFFLFFLFFLPLLLYTFLQFVSIPVALVLFTLTKKGDQLHTSRADITVSYILLVGATVLDVSSATILLFSKFKFNLPPRFFHVANHILPSCITKQWSEKLAQYSIIKRHVIQHTTGMASVRQWIGRRLGGWGVGLLDLTHIPITKPIKEFILDNLLFHGTRGEWHIASTRGLLVVRNWMNSHQDEASTKTGKTLEKIISSCADFPMSVLIWHIATDICYYSGDNTSTNSDQAKKDKEVSRELSNYIMYLVFKCGVKLTTDSQIVHDKAHREITRDILPEQTTQGEKAAVMQIFEANKTEQQQDHSIVEIKKQEEPVDKGNNVAENHVQKLLQSARDLDSSPVLPRACKLAQELISIIDEADRWGLIAGVWSEMLYYTAPRCGANFHYEHLSTGGEFATHVLVLMRELGPFLPPPNNA